jgi:rubrerythrin
LLCEHISLLYSQVSISPFALGLGQLLAHSSLAKNTIMNLLTYGLHLLSTGATAYFQAQLLRNPQTRPDYLAGLQLAEAGSVPFLTALSERAAQEGDAWMAEKLAAHAADERCHGQILAQALKWLGKQPPDLEEMRAKAEARQVSGESQTAESRNSFLGNYFQGYGPNDLKPEQIDWSVFMASTYILELDASQEFLRMASALPTDPVEQKIAQGIRSIASDEANHASYLAEAMQRRYSYAQRQQLIDEWRTRKVNALLATAGHLLQQGDNIPKLAREAEPQEASPALLTVAA